MKIGAYYSHLNGYEWLIKNKPQLWKEVEDTIKGINAYSLPPKIGRGAYNKGKVLLGGTPLNKAFDTGFSSRGWKKSGRIPFVSTSNIDELKKVINLDIKSQKAHFKSLGMKFGKDFHNISIEFDFEKDRVGLEVQFGKYFSVQYDIYTKFVPLYNENKIDLGIEIVPMKSMSKNMVAGPANFERNAHEIIRQGRTNPPCPLILIGIEP